jgi:hypothetical protein
MNLEKSLKRERLKSIALFPLKEFFEDWRAGNLLKKIRFPKNLQVKED